MDCEPRDDTVGGMANVPQDLAAALGAPRVRQRAFGYPLQRWREWVGHLESVNSVLGQLPPRLDRQQTAELIDSMIPDQVTAAFTISMIWGHGYSGYGPYRTACVLTGSKKPKNAPVSLVVHQQLLDSTTIAREHGAVEAYRYLNNPPGKIRGLGPAFFTKWLFFATAEGDIKSPAAAPVLDALVFRWLRDHADVTLRAGKTSDYERYFSLLRSWGEPHALAPAEVEEQIFRLIRQDGAEQDPV